MNDLGELIAPHTQKQDNDVMQKLESVRKLMKEYMTKLNKEANMLIKEIRGVLDDGEYTLEEITPKCIQIFALRIQR